MNTSILIICTGNSCRSQMAHGFLRSFDPGLEVFSAGTRPEVSVNPYAIKVMAEVGVDISSNKPHHVDEYTDRPFDYVITVCDSARMICPVFSGPVKERLHIGFEDPADARGSEQEIMNKYRQIRDEIRVAFRKFYDRLG